MESFFAHRQVAPANTSSRNEFQPLFSVLGAPSPAVEPATSTSLAVERTPPQVEFVETEGRVTKIVVTCRCCERIELDCEY